MNTVETVLNVDALVDEYLATSEETDPEVIAATLAAKVPESALRDALRQSLLQTVYRRINVRNGIQRRNLHSERWKRVGEEIMRRRISEVGGKFLRDLTRDEVLAVAERHRELVRHHERNADTFDRLAALMEQERAETVGELAELEVVEIFNA